MTHLGQFFKDVGSLERVRAYITSDRRMPRYVHRDGDYHYIRDTHAHDHSEL